VAPAAFAELSRRVLGALLARAHCSARINLFHKALRHYF
jgi:hypothetical protein